MRSLLIAAVVVPTLAACAVVGGGGTTDSDCESDVSGSENTPVATAAYDQTGTSCNNNEFVDTDLDAYAYPAADDDHTVSLLCTQEGGEGASYELFELIDGEPGIVLSGDCDGVENTSDNNLEGNSYILVIDHPADSAEVAFSVTTYTL